MLAMALTETAREIIKVIPKPPGAYVFLGTDIKGEEAMSLQGCGKAVARNLASSRRVMWPHSRPTPCGTRCASGYQRCAFGQRSGTPC